MAQNLAIPPTIRAGPSSPSRTTRSSTSISPSRASNRQASASVSPRASHKSLQRSSNQENEPLSPRGSNSGSTKMNGKLHEGEAVSAKGKDIGNGGGKIWRDGSLEPEDPNSTIRSRKPVTRSKSSSSTISTTSNGKLPTLPTILDSDSPFIEDGTPSKSPPPAPSAGVGSGIRPVTRPRRSSSIKRKPSPGVTPTKAVDWEIPRKTLHSSIGFLTLLLNWFNPPSIRPLLTVLITGLVAVSTVDFIRLKSPAFAGFWEQWFGFLMRESERDKINGVVWYLVGVVFVLGLYPRDVAVVAILTLSWSDTTASTIGRLWGKHTPPLPAHVPFIKFLPFAPRKSLAGFLAATVTGSLIGLGFWWNGSSGRWDILDGKSWLGLGSTALAVGVGGAVVEALDLGLDDNLTLPILSGAVVWLWLSFTNLIF